MTLLSPLISRRTFVAFAAAALAGPAIAFRNSAGSRIETLPQFGTRETPAPRVRVWLPREYNSALGRFPTLYMLDGQFAFAGDSDGVNFAVDQRLERLTRKQIIRPTIVVAIDNLEEERFLQYMPHAIYERGPAGLRQTVEREISRTGGKPLVSTEFVQYLTSQLKPFIDNRYRTAPDRLETAIFGASMAGVMAGAIFVEGQHAFGRAACMSPNWPVYDARMIDHPGLPALWAKYFAQLGAPEGRRLWLDHGTIMMDAGMAPHQVAIAKELTGLGWQRGRNLEARVYQGAGHAFAETAVQMDEALAWLLR